MGFLNESKVQEMSPDEILKTRGGGQEDAERTMLSFNNIKKIFGNSDYLTRFRIAQALKLMGDDFFPTNSKFKNLESNKDLTSKDGIFLTFYIGEKDQNDKMDKFSEEILKVVKPVVKLMEKTPSEIGKFASSDSINIPEIRVAKVESQKIKK